VVPYGGLLQARLAPGETVVIHGATGAYGSAAVLVAIALGASYVVAGRNRDALERLGALPRFIPVAMTGDAAADTHALRDAAGPPDCALDMVGRANSADGTLATLHRLGRGGRLVLMGSMTVPLPVDYAQLLRAGREILGNFMYPSVAPRLLLQLAASGQLALDRIPVDVLPLAELPEAMRRADQPGAPLVVIADQ
jgi:alcohol dehydrogenase